jgi:photosystem II stability/assembly factor-like uncharacterized protein
MPRPGADRIVTQKHIRAFSQRGGPGPENQVRYGGADEAYMQIGDITDPPGRGGSDPIFFHSTSRRGSFDAIGRSISTPDAPSGSISFMLGHGGVPWVDYGMECDNNFYEVVGACKQPNDFVDGWADHVVVYSRGQAQDRSRTGNTTQESDDASMREVDFQFAAVYTLGALNFGQKAGTEVEREVVALEYASTVECGNCGVADDGTKRLYAVTKSSGAGSPGTPAEVVYTTDGGLNWTNVNITGMGGTVDPTGLKVVGNYVVVLDTAGSGYWFAEINTLTGVPGSWTNVTAGFVASKQPQDMYVVGPNEVYFVGNGGYVYKSTDIPSGVTVLDAGNATTNNLIRIHGDGGDVLVAVGESGRIIKSLNRGATWATTTTSPTSATVRAIGVVTPYRFWIGTSGGLVYYTINGGETFSSAVSLPGGTLAVIDDIVVVTEEVIHIAARTATPTGRLITTWNGGASWASSAVATQRIQSLPTASRYNRIAVPRDVDPTTMGNTVALGGLSGGGTDGIVAIGLANKV